MAIKKRFNIREKGPRSNADGSVSSSKITTDVGPVKVLEVGKQLGTGAAIFKHRLRG